MITMFEAKVDEKYESLTRSDFGELVLFIVESLSGIQKFKSDMQMRNYCIRLATKHELIRATYIF